MESLIGALDRLAAQGYTADFFARDGQLARADCEHPVAPDDAVIDDIVRFEGDSDPVEELGMYAISSGPRGRKGTYPVAFGPESRRYRDRRASPRRPPSLVLTRSEHALRTALGSAGAPNLVATRFSNRPAPLHPGGVPNCPDWVQQMACSHELQSCGFWPGGSAEGSFYAYAYPQADGFAEWPVEPAAASYDHDLGEFVLPYGAVRTDEDPDAMLLIFFESTCEAAAGLAGWDRAALEVTP